MTSLLIVARALAIAIAVLGVIDPTITTARRGRPEVAVVSLDHRDSALAERTRDALDNDFTVVRGEYTAAAATVVVGDRLPDRLPPRRVFRVHEQDERAMSSFTVPRTSTTEARIPVEIGWTSAAPAVVELIVDEVVVDRAEVTPSYKDGAARMSFTPVHEGPLLVTARVITGGDTLLAHAATDVVDRPRPVLFFDRRPSWMSTFVRRSLERDRRFTVASRVITSRGISSDASGPPSTLADPLMLEIYDVIVGGAPSSLTAADVAGLESFLRRRGGTVVLLFDERPTAGPVDRLTGVAAWSGATPVSPLAVGHDDNAKTLMLNEVAWPGALPIDARTELGATVGAAARPVVWSRQLGMGQVIVNGALDAWKFRDPASSRFDEFWRATISRAARETPDRVTIELSSTAVEPRDEIMVTIIARDSTANIVAELKSDSAATPLRLWPGSRRGEYHARIIAGDAGRYSVAAMMGDGRVESGFVVADRIDRPRADPGAIETLVRASGGVSGSANEVAGAIRSSTVAEPRREPWRPMRNGWWIIPFAGLLGVEWLARRRRGLA